MVTESKKPGKKVLIVEDHPIVSDSLFRLINDTFENVTCVHAATGF